MSIEITNPEKSRNSRLIIVGVLAVLLIAAAGVTGYFFYLRNRADTLVGQGRAALAVGDYQAATQALDQALAIQPSWVRQHDDGVILLARAQAYRGQEELQAAVDDVDRVLALNPEQVDALLLRGAAYRELGDRDAALADCEAAISLAPDRAEPYLCRGLVQLDGWRVSDAIDDLTRAIELDESGDTSFQALVNRGWVHFLEDDTKAARADAQAALEIDPDSAMAQALLGAVFASEGNLAGGLDTLNQAVSRASDDETVSRALYLRARTHLASGQAEAALSDAEQIVAWTPDWSWGYLLRGDVHLARDENPQAQFDYQQAVDLDPESGIVYVRRAAGYLQAEEYGAARADLDTVLSLLPDYAPALVLRAQANAITGDVDAALADLDRALALAPELVAAHAQRADIYFGLDDWPNARADYDRVLAARPGDLSALSQRAQVAFALADYAAAVDDLDAAIALHPDDANLIALRAEAYLALDNLELAFRDAQHALSLDGSLPGAQFIEGLFQLEQERYFQAVIDLTKAIELDPEMARAYAARARAHFESNDPDRARADATRALELDAELAQAYLARALVRVYERDWDDAFADADQAVDLAPDDKKVWATRGRIYLDGGDANAALDDFEQALTLDPDWIDGRLWRALALDYLVRYDDAITALQSVLEVASDVDDIELAESSIADLERIPDEANGMRTWSDVYHEFDITYPENWRQYVDPGEEVPILLMGPLDKDYRANLFLSVMALDFTFTPSQLAKAYGPSANDLLDYELLSEENIRVSGRAAVRRVFTWTAVDERLRDVPVTVIQVYAIIDKHAVIFTATMRAEGAEKYEPVFEDIIASFDFG